jgi:hypothetical protein
MGWQHTHGMWLGIVVMGCAASSQTREVAPATPLEIEVDAASCAASPGGCGSAPGDGPFVLETKLRALRVRGDRATTLMLGNGATVVDGDRLKVFLRASQDGYLYLAFCSRNARDARYDGLKVFPEDGAIRVRANQTTIAPDPMADIVLDDKPGPESLYLILSRNELSQADAELAQVIADARQGNESGDCGEQFHRAVTGPRKKSISSQGGGERPATPARRQARPKLPKAASKGVEEDPVIEIQRGGDVVWNDGVAADPDGIVVLRYRLTHVAAPSPAHHGPATLGGSTRKSAASAQPIDRQ